VGIDDRFGQSAHNYNELLEEYDLTSDAVVNAVKKLNGKK
jgi:transketolase C-terminal domain/subunit